MTTSKKHPTHTLNSKVTVAAWNNNWQLSLQVLISYDWVQNTRWVWSCRDYSVLDRGLGSRGQPISPMFLGICRLKWMEATHTHWSCSCCEAVKVLFCMAKRIAKSIVWIDTWGSSCSIIFISSCVLPSGLCCWLTCNMLHVLGVLSSLQNGTFGVETKQVSK